MISDDETGTGGLRRQRALLKLIASNPSDRQLLELCNQWGVEPVQFGFKYGRQLNRLGTLAGLAKAALHDRD